MSWMISSECWPSLARGRVSLNSGTFGAGQGHVFAHGLQHGVGVRRLGHEIRRLVAERLARGFQRAVARQHDDRDIFVDLAHVADAFQAGASGHAVVHDDRVDPGRLELFHSVGHRVGDADVVVVLEQDAQALAGAVIIVNDENLGLG